MDALEALCNLLQLLRRDPGANYCRRQPRLLVFDEEAHCAESESKASHFHCLGPFVSCRQPRLLVCDEATSALDSGTEAGIMASLAELAAGRTAVFVAHRLSTIQVRPALQFELGPSLC